ncbi:PQQ-binding-like beta-propeller repeat protein [Solimicrobium silvestre]|uniref:Pyrrolo-quinoline quinone repeat domain-containing protein n=1 Tax=Solimicrobium silvestre TaxID=2099400 RepID=A0A2S9H0E6_9BURK|nr:PQQ-binding-like beta-propeller repeat protein [Solimicrobium silvestre]PRC93420.1 hypothetical protein S2091_1807 [Solimicrobium silvestre]
MQFRTILKRGAVGAAFVLCGLATAQAQSNGDWPLYSHDYSNTNSNPDEVLISRQTAPKLQRAWSTFNDSQWRPTPPPTGFVLEGALGLKFPASVVGVIAPPLIRNGTIYYIDVLGTMFARDAKTGTITDPARHWTTTLVDPDYLLQAQPIGPEMYYAAPVISDGIIWIHSSLNGRIHAIRQIGGAELDFDPTTPGIQPLALVPDQQLASNLGEPVIVTVPSTTGARKLFVTEVNVILNDALIQGGQAGFVVAMDITDPAHPFEAWRTSTIDINPATGKRYGAGVSAGSGFAVDHKLHLIYGGTGQNTVTPYPGYPDATHAPAGYIDRSDSLYAIDYRTGKFVWVSQFHKGDVFDINNPVSAGPERTDGPRDADVLSPPVMFTARTADGQMHDLVGAGSKGGLYRVVDRATGATIWQKQISKPTGLGGIQAGSAYANGIIYVAGFEGIDDGFSDANFDTPTSKYKNAFFATFSPAFWADVEDVRDDRLAITGMQTKVYALDAGTGNPVWKVAGTGDYLLLKVGATMRHLSLANGLLYITTSSGQLFVVSTLDGSQLYTDQTQDLNALFNLGLGKPHHASMNGGTLISNGMVFVPYGAQNNPSGGMIAYRLGH